MAGLVVGSLMIEMAADVARVKKDMAEVRALVGDSMGAVKQSTAQAQQANESLMQSFGFMKVAIGGIGFIGLATQVKAAGAAILGAQTEVDRFNNRMKLASGGIGDAGRELDYVRGMASRLGLSLLPAMDGYSKLAAAARGTSLEGERTRKVFEAISKASVVMGLSAEQTNGALLALQQMVSKGTVQAEELRGQLGERLPGAFQIAARAMGVSTQELGKMLEQGQVLADDFLPKFASQLERELAGSVEDATKSAQAALNQFGNAWEDLKIQIANSGLGEAIANQLRIGAEGLKLFSERGQASQKTGGSFIGGGLAGILDAVSERFVPGLSTTRGATLDELYKQIESIKALPLPGLREGHGPWALSLSEAHRFAVAGDRQAQIDAIQAEISRRTQALAPDQSAAEDARLARLGTGSVADPFAVNAMLAGLGGGDAKKRANLLGQYGSKKTQRDLVMDEALAAFNGDVPAEVLAGINEKFKDKAGAREAAKSVKEYAQALNEAAGITNDYLPSLTLYQKLLADGRLTQDQYTEAIERLIGKQPISKKLVDEEISARNQLAGVTDDYLPSLEKLAAQYEAGGISLEQYQAAVQLLIAKQPSAKRLTDEYTKSMKEQEEARKRHLATQEAQFTAQEQEIGGLARHAQQLEDANRLLGMNAEERFKVADAQRAMQIQELEYLLVAERSMSNDDRQIRYYEEKIRYLQKIRGLEQQAYEGAKREDFFKDMERGITDGLMRGFEGGKGFLENFVDTTKNMFATLILRPRIEALVRYGVSGASSFFGLANPASTLASDQGFNPLSAAGGAVSLGSAFTFGSMGSNFVAGLGSTFSGVGLGTSLGAASAGVGAGATSASLAYGLGAVAPYLAAIVAIVSLLSKGGETRSGGQYGYRDGKVVWLEGPSGGDPTADNTIRAIETAQQSIYNLVGQLGGTGGGVITRAGYEFSKYHDKRFSEIFVNDAGRRYYGETSDFSNDEVTQYFAADLQRAVILGVQAAELDKHFAEYFAKVNPFELSSEEITNIIGTATAIKQMTDQVAIAGGVFLKFADTSVEARQRIVELTGGLDSFNQKFSSYIGNYYTETEQAQIQAAQIRSAMKEAGIFGDWLGNKEQFRWLMDSLDPNGQLGAQQVATMLNVESQFAQLTQFMQANNVTLGDLASQVPDSIAAAIERTTANQINAQQQMASTTDLFSGTVNEFGQYVTSMGESARIMRQTAELMQRLAQSSYTGTDVAA